MLGTLRGSRRLERKDGAADAEEDPRDHPISPACRRRRRVRRRQSDRFRSGDGRCYDSGLLSGVKGRKAGEEFTIDVTFGRVPRFENLKVKTAEVRYQP